MIKKAKARTTSPGMRALARESQRQPSNDQRPMFTFHLVSRPFRVADCQATAKASFADWLEEVSQLTWQQIHQSRRESWGTEQIPVEQFTATVPSSITPDQSLTVMRFGGGARVAGYREDAVFHVIFVDPNHNAY